MFCFGKQNVQDHPKQNKKKWTIWMNWL